MTKKHTKDEVKNLKKELGEELKKTEHKNCKSELEKLKQENEKLKKKLSDTEEILKNTQVQYLSLKNEFDAYQKRVEASKKKLEQDIFEKTILKMLPIVELFLISYEHLPEDFKNHKWTEGLSLISKKIEQFLKDNGIKLIPTVWEEVDEMLHEIIQVQPVEDSDKKWKILQEVKKGYMLEKGGEKKVLVPAKVVLWQ